MICMSLFCMHFHVPLWCPSSLPTSQPAARLTHHEAARNAVPFRLLWAPLWQLDPSCGQANTQAACQANTQVVC